MNAVEQRLTAATRVILETHIPAGAPEDFIIRAEQETAKLARPYLVVSAEDAGAPHPSMRKMVLTLTTVRRTDDETTSPPEELHQRFVNAMEYNFPALAAALAGVQLRLRKVVTGGTGEEIVSGRGESSSASWTLWLQILPPP